MDEGSGGGGGGAHGQGLTAVTGKGVGLDRSGCSKPGTRCAMPAATCSRSGAAERGERRTSTTRTACPAAAAPSTVRSAAARVAAAAEGEGARRTTRADGDTGAGEASAWTSACHRDSAPGSGRPAAEQQRARVVAARCSWTSPGRSACSSPITRRAGCGRVLEPNGLGRRLDAGWSRPARDHAPWETSPRGEARRAGGARRAPAGLLSLAR